MAIWQFDFYIAKEERFKKCNDFNEIISWKDYTIDDKVISELSNTFARGVSWSKKVELFGNNDETCIKIAYENKQLSEISFRLDLRNITREELSAIMQFINGVGGGIVVEDKFYKPTHKNMSMLIKKSPAYSFCENPKKFFDSLASNNNEL